MGRQAETTECGTETDAIRPSEIEAPPPGSARI